MNPLEAAHFEKRPQRAEAWSIEELTHRIRGLLEPPFSQVWVKGEVSNYKPAVSGHAYFSLKDAGASIAAACFGWGARHKQRSFELKEGLSVLCRGKVVVYPPRGYYQLVVDLIEPLGLGDLQQAFEQLKKKLADEGLFRLEDKRPLPRFPKKIAVVTSPTGAVIQDILKILKRRAPHIEVCVVPSLVQGKEAPAQLVTGLSFAQQISAVDLIVLARGGGSVEDLWAFNDEALARCVRASRIPVISAVGHEVDFTIADFVADLRAPTPSAAAEILSEHWVQGLPLLGEYQRRLQQSLWRDFQHRRQLLDHVVARLVSPQDRLREQVQRLDEAVIRLQKAWLFLCERKKAILQRSTAQLEALSPLRVLERGYALVHEAGSQKILRSAKTKTKGDYWKVQFQDGSVLVQVVES